VHKKQAVRNRPAQTPASVGFFLISVAKKVKRGKYGKFEKCEKKGFFGKNKEKLEETANFGIFYINFAKKNNKIF
jgi:hypothetical protein